MMLKQRRLMKALEDKDCTTMRAAGIKAGYSKESREIYAKPTKAYIAEAIGNKPELIIKRYEDLALRCRVKDDLATERAVYDSLCRVNGMFRDKTEVNIRSLAPSSVSVEEIQEARRVLAIDSVKSTS